MFEIKAKNETGLESTGGPSDISTATSEVTGRVGDRFLKRMTSSPPFPVITDLRNSSESRLPTLAGG